ncbi:SpoIIE family protein phosphatase, partial [bacterium]|nr:SpoIIE family protein phosphatase [bacterium]
KDIIEGLKARTDRITWTRPYFEDESTKKLLVSAGVGIYEKDKLVGISTVDWELNDIKKMISEMRLTPNSFVLFANICNGSIYVSTDKFLDSEKLTGKSLDYIPWYNPSITDMSSFVYHDIKYISYVKMLDNGMLLIVNIPEDEMIFSMFIHLIYGLLVLFGICLLISWIFYIILRDNIATPIDKLIKIANKISRGDLDAEIKVEKPEEFVKLAQTFDKMANDIKTTAKDREKIDSELQIARNIQSSSLPSIFPPFPDRKDFDIYARMHAAKEVGGDFYDFYFIDENQFMFLIADVSGKGIPAALFMMTTKTLVNNLSQIDSSASELIERINNKICQTNKKEMFVTMLAGIFNVNDGRLTLINCGHNPPLLKRHDGDWEYLDLKSNIVLGIFPNYKFDVQVTYLKPHDKNLIYTDGATEALNDKEELYGEERLKNILNQNKDKDVQATALAVQEDIGKFSGLMPQADDITMLIFEFKGANKVYRDKADRKNYAKFNEWLENNCAELKLSDDVVMKIKLSAEEIYTNIISYAYPENIDDVEVLMNYNDREVLL